MKSGFELYTDQRRIRQITKHNKDVASGKKCGELRFNHAFIDLERICNLSCRGCFKYMNTDKSRMKLGFDDVTMSIDFAHKRGARVIIIAGAGEPILDTDFRRIIEYIDARNMKSVVFTNGTMLNKELSNFLLDHNVSLILKRTAIEEKKQNYLVGVEGANERMQAGMGTLLDVRQERERTGKPISEICVECYITRENLTDVGDVLRFCRDSGLTPYIEAFVMCGQEDEAKLAPSQEELNRAFEEMAKKDKVEYGIRTKLKNDSRVYGSEPCIKSYAGFAVLIDGSVRECITGNHRFGSIREHNLNEIFDLGNPLVRDFYSGKCCRCKCSLTYRSD